MLRIILYETCEPDVPADRRYYARVVSPDFHWVGLSLTGPEPQALRAALEQSLLNSTPRGRQPLIEATTVSVAAAGENENEIGTNNLRLATAHCTQSTDDDDLIG